MNAGSVSTSGNDGEGLYAFVDGGTGTATVTMTGGTVTTSGSEADGIVALVSDGSAFSTIPGNAIVTFSGGNIVTTGTGSSGIVAQTDATIFGASGDVFITQSGGTITTTGDALSATQLSAGIVGLGFGPGSVFIRQEAGSITTEGALGHGIYSSTVFGNVSVVQDAGAVITANGTNADGIHATSLSGGSHLVDISGLVQGGSGTGVGIRLLGSAGSEVYVRTGGTVSALSGVAIYDSAGPLLLENWGQILGDIQTFGGDDDVRLQVASVTTGQMLLGLASDTLTIAGTADISGVTLFDGGDDASASDGMVDRLTFAGGTRILSASALQNWEQIVLADGAALTLNGNALQTGSGGTYASLSLGISIDSTSSLAVADPVLTVFGDVTNAGLISFTHPTIGSQFVVAGDYVGQNGVIALRATLDGDGSPSDRLVLDGGTASGETSLRIVNAGGMGARTVGNGILVVETFNGAATSADAFGLATRVVAGGYEYRLFQGGLGGDSPQDWFLRSFYRPEVSLYAPVPALARQLGMSTLGTLHERVGDTTTVNEKSRTGDSRRGSWARVVGERVSNEWKGSVDTQAKSATIGVFQVGTDIAQFKDADGQRNHLGVYIAQSRYSASRVALAHENSAVGKLALEGPAVGLYWTHFGASGWYADAVMQASFFNVEVNPASSSGTSTSGFGFTASIEAGYPIEFAGGWRFEPQAQAIMQTTSVDATNDAYSRISWIEGDAFTARAGVRLLQTAIVDSALWRPYAKANLWHSFSGKDQALFDVAAPGVDNRYGGTRLEFGVGVTVRVDRALSAFGHADYRWSIGGSEKASVLQAAAGLKWHW